MGSRPRIGVTGDHRRWSPSWLCIQAILRLLGAEPQRISVRHPALGEKIDGLVVSGGNDIGPDLYGGEEMPSARLNPERDALESNWIRRALKDDLPVLGICRGAQLLNVVLGGSLIQDVRGLRQKTSNKANVLPTKSVAVAKKSLLASELGRSTLRVNSLHHQAVLKPGDNLNIVARDRDHLCQAIEAGNGITAFGVQWHPEYLFYVPAQWRLFQWLVDHSAERKS